MKQHRTWRRSSLVAAPLLAGLIALSGCSMNAPDDVISPTDSEPSAAQDSDPTPETSGDKSEQSDDKGEDSGEVGPAEAGEIALAEYGEIFGVVEIEIERSGGMTVWEVEIAGPDTKYEVEVDVATGEIVNDREQRTSHLQEYQTYLEQAELTFSDAIDVALEQHPESRVIELELDEEHGRLVWEVSVITADSDEYELDIDASNGDVLKNEYDD